RHLALPDAVAGICGNPVVLLFSRALSNWSADITPAELGTPAVRERETQRVNDILRALGEAIIAGDAKTARQAAEAFTDSSLKVSRLLEERRQRTTADDWAATADADGDGKLAQKLALALALDVAARGWPRERFGDEAGLIARFGVSRSILREAIRMLELHGIVRPQRGRGGGLMIGLPNADYTIASAKRYLRRAGLVPADYLAVRETLESGAIALAVRRGKDAEFADLETLNAQLQNADDSAITPIAIEWHARLSRLGHNRALSLLLRILFTLTEESQPRLPPTVATTLRKRHARLTKALVARKEDAAQAVAREHVAWLEEVLRLGLGTLTARTTA
ncbi:MAG: FadR/GntR family transcriptional regulator, partial [Myxococcota bacterium]